MPNFSALIAFILTLHLLLKQITSITVARSISIVSALLVSMILARIISAELLGQYKTIWMLYGVLGPVVTSSMSGLMYYLGKDDTRLPQTITVSLAISLFSGIVMLLLVILGFPWWEQLFHAQGMFGAFRNFGVYMFFSGFSSGIESVFILKHRNKWLFYHNLISNAIELITVVVPFYLGYSLETVTLFMILSPFLRSVFLVAFTSNEWRFTTWISIKPELKNDLNYYGGLVMVAMAGVASIHMDSWFVRWFYVDDALFAHYVMGARKIPFLSALLSAISSALIVQLGKRLQNGQLTDTFLFIRTISSTLFSALIPFLMIFLLYAKQLMLLLFDGFQASAPVFQIYLGTVIVHFLFADTVLLALGNSKNVFWASLIELLVNAVLSISFLYIIGFTGPAWATLISHFVYIGICKIQADKKLGQKIPFRNYFSIRNAKRGLLVAFSIPIVWYVIENGYRNNRTVFIAMLIIVSIIQAGLHFKSFTTFRTILFPEKPNDVAS